MPSCTQDVTQDQLLNGRLSLWQPKSGYRFAIDPVFLAAALPVREGEYVIELGAGVGAASLCLLARQPNLHLVAVEFQESLALLAAKNAQENGYGRQFSLFQADIGNKEQISALNAWNKADHILTNPPYLAVGQGRGTENHSKYLANVETSASLDVWVKVSAGLLKPKGLLTMIHRADRLDEILVTLTKYHFGAIKIFPLWPKTGQTARRVVIQAKSQSKEPCQMLGGLVLHQEDGAWTDAAEQILSGQALSF